MDKLLFLRRRKLKAVVLAAGKGERLEPITHTRNKTLAPLLGETLLERTINILSEFVDEIYLIVDNPEQFTSIINNPILRVVVQEEQKGTAFALKSVNLNDEFILVYGDIYADSGLFSKVASCSGNCVVGVEVGNPNEYGVLNYQNDRLVEIIEKPEVFIGNYVNAGIYKFSEKIFNYIDKISPSVRGEYELTDAVNLLAKENEVKVITYSGTWLDVGRPWQVIELNKLALQKIETKIEGEIEREVKIKGRVIIERGARIRGCSYIEGPAYIGSNTEVGPNAHIRPYTVIGRGAKVGTSVEVKESVIMENTKIPHLSYVGDSVICESVNLGAGTITANLRFDEESVKVNVRGVKVSSGRKKLGAFIGGYVKTGINVSIMPGVKIGAYSIIYPNKVVDRDVNKGEILK
ncbi:nucleotidyltransferase [Sulfolobales archaeon HS-7]|nr:nucleotidyltransferase [Sulfolobales archaeon HS-7]